MALPLERLEPQIPIVTAHVGKDRKTVKLENVPADFADDVVIVLSPVVEAAAKETLVLRRLIQKGVAADKIQLCCLFLSPQAADHFAKEFPEVSVVAASIESNLDENGFLVPGVGDFEGRYNAD